MAKYRRAFIAPDVLAVHAAFDRVLRSAARLDRLGGPGGSTRAVALRAYLVFNRELEALAVRTAADATKRIILRIEKTASRPDTGVRPHMRDAVVSRPFQFGGVRLQTGAVGVADEDVLDALVDPLYPAAGSYWLAQELGTRKHMGRVLRGYFYGPGFSNPDVPRATRPNPLQPLFVPGAARAGPAGGGGGKGTIQRPINPRFFVRDGANAAAAEWRRGMARIETTTLKSLNAVISPARIRRRAPVGGAGGIPRPRPPRPGRP